MEESRYRPRNYCAEPKAFGKAEAVGWLDVGPEEQIRLRAAQLQNQYAVRIHQRLREKNRSLAWYAELVGETYDRMTKVLRGVLPMRLDDLAGADLHLGGVSHTGFAVASADVAEAANPPYRPTADDPRHEPCHDFKS